MIRRCRRCGLAAGRTGDFEIHSLHDDEWRALGDHYALPAWDDQSYREHKRADHLAAASKGLHVVGWSCRELDEDLEITVEPLDHDPLAPTQGFAPWEPWPAAFAAERFLETLEFLAAAPGQTPRANSKAAWHASYS